MKTRLAVVLVLVLVMVLAAAVQAAPPPIQPDADDPGGGGGMCVRCITCWQPNSGEVQTICKYKRSCPIGVSCPVLPPPFQWIKIGDSGCGC